jgi:cell filamentation protein
VKSSPVDPYCYPGTNILRNLLDLRDEVELNSFEAAMVAIHLVRLTEEPIEGEFGTARLRETHRRIFGSVYEWAGQLRKNTGTMTKQRPAGHRVTYGDSAYVESGLLDTFEKLKRENFLRGSQADSFAIRSAHFYGELDAIHPFREGNSRTLRQFFSDLAREAGFKIDWTATSATAEDREALILARDIAVVRGDSSSLAHILRTHLQTRG